MIHCTLIPIVAQLSDVEHVIDKAAAQNDRYLFIACLVLLLILCGLVIRWLVNSLEAKDLAHSKERADLNTQAAQERTTFADRIDRERASFEDKFERERVENRTNRQADKTEFLKALESLTDSLKAKS